LRSEKRVSVPTPVPPFEGQKMTPLFGMFNLSPTEILIILGLGVLFYGKRLPEVGRYLGKGIVEFKKGMKGFEDEIEGVSAPPRHEPPALEPPRPPQRVATTAPKFEDNATNITTPPHS
jgi:sec-independent protein translocase protein TatA